MLEHARRCRLDGESYLALSSHGLRAELLGIGYRESEVSEEQVRRILRRLVGLLRRH